MFSLFNRILNGVSTKGSQRRQSSAHRNRLQLERLEDRVVFASTVSVPAAVSMSEGDSYLVPIIRTGDLSKPLTVNYAFTSESAGSNDVYRAKGYSGTVTLKPGIKTLTLSPVTSVDDQIDEYDERFHLSISLPGGSPATLGNSGTWLKIMDNDPAPKVSIAPAESARNEGAGSAYFRVSLDAPSEKDVVAYFEGKSFGTFQWGQDAFFADFPGSTTGSVRFSPRETVEDIRVTIKDDKIVEPNEAVKVSLTYGTNAGIRQKQAQVTIIDNDVPTVVIDDAGSINEGNTAGAKANFKVRVVEAMERAVKVKYWTVAGDANNATDYVSKSGTLTFGGNPGSAVSPRQQSVSVELRADTIKEATAENFFLRVGPIDSTINNRLIVPKTPGKATIVDDDAPKTKTQVGTPAPISAIPTPENGLGVVLYRWAAASNASYYEIELWKDNSKFHSLGSSKGNVTSYSPMYTEWLTEGVYYWRVRAIAADGTEGAWSSEHRFVMPKEYASSR